jgi:hypothetical protein
MELYNIDKEVYIINIRFMNKYLNWNLLNYVQIQLVKLQPIF